MEKKKRHSTRCRLWQERVLIVIMIMGLLASGYGCAGKKETAKVAQTELTNRQTVDKSNMNLGELSVEEIVSMLTLDEMAGQMVQAACYNVDVNQMKTYDYGSVFNIDTYQNATTWKAYILNLQKAAVHSPSGIPYLYGQDDVHGVNYVAGSVIFPHNIGIGAANDEDLTYKMGLAVADEAKMAGMLWNFAPCVAAATEPRWGRTYESYSSEIPLVSKLAGAYTKGLTEGGVIACPKHFFGDGSVTYGSGEGTNITDRGNAELSDAQIDELLAVYKNEIDAGARTIMISHSSVNGVKMHENAQYINKLKDDFGFDGFIVSDWESIHHISGDTFNDQVITAVNSGIDMLMEPESYELCRTIIVNAVKEGKISEDRVTDAVTRIIRVKKEAGILSDPIMEHVETVQKESGSKEYRDLAEQLVEKSLVLLKNENQTLPFKKGTKVYVTGPAADNVKAQCVGWSREWMGSIGVDGVTTILDGLKQVSQTYGIEIITDPKEAESADVTLLCIGEDSYAEWNGDTRDMSVTGQLALKGNQDAMKEAKNLKAEHQIPIVTCIIAGRQVLLGEDAKDWDSIVMCYLPGSEGQGVAHMLAGKQDFSGKLPMPWYEDVEQIGTKNALYSVGFGLTTK